ncbi:MAG: hypothetical protein KAV87_19515 [Desulfobacteraceae bacterium]|nr:hypothetical protein [Desulfobacteraceae bacterium]
MRTKILVNGIPVDVTVENVLKGLMENEKNITTSIKTATVTCADCGHIFSIDWTYRIKITDVIDSVIVQINRHECSSYTKWVP